MDILWPALGISVIVGFVFYVLAGHWGKLIRQQAGTIRHLADRVQMIEEVDSPRFRERLGESAPAPLEQVFTFSFRLSNRFWRDTLRLSDSDWDYVRSFGNFVASVKLERWRSHTAVNITEVLPDHKTAAWQTRSLYDYPTDTSRGECLTLWELSVARPALGQYQPSIALLLRANAIELAGTLAAAREARSANGQATSHVMDEQIVFFRVPIELSRLAEFRSHDPADAANGNGASNGHGAGSWRSFYAWEDEAMGIEWQLRVVDLNRKTDWEQWRILEPAVRQVKSGS